ncbi:DUF3306 domain-containing protein [Methylobacterium planeticum]|uniref:DUF3306 domain-containing protein n=1 Tax=Methylobacterium planeticum TaxID=2615211 RepID=A0A6N6MID9_9HYPH|nr:DUF3306 domain-containing protein [Methylobacterium planeticum]KAB1070827.1 DUF3306 domain-containing protein [Methylobacterium planeticum]
MSGGDFLSRWSRRKRDVAEREAELSGPPQPAALDGPDAPPNETSGTPDGKVADHHTEGTGEALTPEEIAQLPSLDEVGIDTDLTQFLREGVPRVLRNAALRRMWSLDPSIRDYVSEAREYAYDWNVPGGVPGYGPLLPSDDVQGMLERIIGGVTKPGADIGEAVAARADASSGAPGMAALAPEPQVADGSATAALGPEMPADATALAASSEATSLIPADDGDLRHKVEDLSPVRRHGGAIPI